MLRRTAIAILLLVLAVSLSGCIAAIMGGTMVGANAAHDRRGFGTVVDDRRIQLSAYDALNKDKQLALHNRVAIVVYNGVMLLVGEVRNAELKQRAENLVSGFEGVRRLVNEIEVREPEGFWSRRRDNYISGRVKTALLDITSLPGFEPTRVNVTTVHRTVYLFGLVSREEERAVIDIARNVNGVEHVVKIFEYTD
jgi:osmotically-inducible protein OsmY